VAAVSPSSFDDEYVALADTGHVQNWQMKNGTGCYVNTTAVPIAKADISDGGGVVLMLFGMIETLMTWDVYTTWLEISKLDRES
jgi:hypothetical protein